MMWVSKNSLLCGHRGVSNKQSYSIPFRILQVSLESDNNTGAHSGDALFHRHLSQGNTVNQLLLHVDVYLDA